MDDVRDFGPPLPDGPPRSARRTAAGWLGGLALALLTWATTVLLAICLELPIALSGAGLCFALAATMLYGLGVAGIASLAASWGSPGASDAARLARRWIAITGWVFGSMLVFGGVLYAILLEDPDHSRVVPVLITSGIVDVVVLLPLTGVGVARRRRWSDVKAPFPWF
ncbi:hypothetical protein GCM10010988_22910 [Cnuibacter physcomitrellae]|uniref:Uncharacterized protein n=1 Tax=Cnuibacter physcomitrellae TaxID=1619308 RepID=A0A1X9LR81_9MICO|nr:hypothetical protein [Cnuibacter physcomitrellae]ARJ06952.1 hypothetical protein B5808_18255 [Cnuibacter physcomitrellae]GGI39206.1 hypothetical protein GCM10010988_22910 [Cnuibacter physcomitrellae]